LGVRVPHWRVAAAIRRLTLPQDLHALLRRLRLPHIRAHAPEVIATQGPTVGIGRGPRSPLRRGGRAGTLRPGHPPRRRRLPHREDVRGLDTGGVLDPRPDPTGAAHPRMGPRVEQPPPPTWWGRRHRRGAHRAAPSGRCDARGCGRRHGGMSDRLGRSMVAHCCARDRPDGLGSGGSARSHGRATPRPRTQLLEGPAPVPPPIPHDGPGSGGSDRCPGT